MGAMALLVLSWQGSAAGHHSAHGQGWFMAMRGGGNVCARDTPEMRRRYGKWTFKKKKGQDKGHPTQESASGYHQTDNHTTTP